jgi:hypothetical protein
MFDFEHHLTSQDNLPMTSPSCKLGKPHLHGGELIIKRLKWCSLFHRVAPPNFLTKGLSLSFSNPSLTIS